MTRHVAAVIAAILALGYTACRTSPREHGADLPLTYHSDDGSFSIRYPAGFAVNQETGQVRFMIAPDFTRGTNLATDSHLSVETLREAGRCDAGGFLDDHPASRDTSVLGVKYSFASAVGAAAGNRYEEAVFALPGTTPCMAIRYFIHYGVIDNYPRGAVREFDRAALLRTFDAMRATLVTGSPRAAAGPRVLALLSISE